MTAVTSSARNRLCLLSCDEISNDGGVCSQICRLNAYGPVSFDRRIKSCGSDGLTDRRVWCTDRIDYTHRPSQGRMSGQDKRSGPIRSADRVGAIGLSVAWRRAVPLVVATTLFMILTPSATPSGTGLIGAAAFTSSDQLRIAVLVYSNSTDFRLDDNITANGLVDRTYCHRSTPLILSSVFVSDHQLHAVPTAALPFLLPIRLCCCADVLMYGCCALGCVLLRCFTGMQGCSFRDISCGVSG